MVYDCMNFSLWLEEKKCYIMFDNHVIHNLKCYLEILEIRHVMLPNLLIQYTLKINPSI